MGCCLRLLLEDDAVHTACGAGAMDDIVHLHSCRCGQRAITSRASITNAVLSRFLHCLQWCTRSRCGLGIIAVSAAAEFATDPLLYHLDYHSYTACNGAQGHVVALATLL